MPQYILAAYFTLLLILSNSKLIQRRDDYIKLSAKKSSNNLYYTQLFIGNPPQSQKLAIDSGSSYPVIRHHNCQLCSQENLDSISFNPKQSITYKPLNCKEFIEPQCYSYCPYFSNTCNFQIRYGVDDIQSSLSGVIGSDQVRFELPDGNGKQKTKEVFIPNFGLFTRESRVLEKVTSGILGINKYQSSSILFKWFQLNNIPRSDRKIGLCFSGNNGYLEFGNIKQQQTKSIKLKQAFYLGGQYSFKVDKMSIKEHQITPNYTYMIDSGSQVMIFPTKFFDQVVQIAKDVCFMNFITCSQMDSTEPLADYMDMNIDYQAKCYQINNFNVFDIDQYLNYNYPPIQMKVGDNTFKIMPSEYMEKIAGSIFYSFVCLRIKPSIQQMYLLGVRWMQGRKIIFHLKQEVIQIFQGYNCVDFYQQIQSWAEDITIPQIIAIGIVIVLSIWYCLRKKLSRKSQQIELSTF